MNKNGITVLSLFDGMSCGQIALKELGIKVDKYYASEIDKHAIKQTMLNFPDTIQLGSVTDVDARKLGHIDLLIGGSPCTNFSFAGRRNGMNTTTNEEIYTFLPQALQRMETKATSRPNKKMRCLWRADRMRRMQRNVL